MSTVSGANSGTSSTSSFASKYSSNRMTGLFSSLDTDSIVESLTAAQQTKLNKVKQQQTRETWLEDAWTGVRDTINTFQNTYTSITSSSSMLKTATYYSYKVTSDSTSNAVSLSASSTTAVGDYTVQVDQLAKNASVSSSNISSKGTTEIAASNTAKLSELKFANALQFVNNNISFSINGKAFTFSKDTTLQNMINTVNSDTDAGVTMKYSRLTNGFTITADAGGADSKVVVKNIFGNAFGTNSAFGIAEGAVTASGTTLSSKGVSVGIDTSTALSSLSFANAMTFDSGSISFNINGKEFTFASTTRLQDMLDTINNDVTANVTMEYNSASDGFTVRSDISGGSVSIQNLTGNAFGTNSAFGIPEGTASSGAVSVTSKAISSGGTGFSDLSATLSGLSFAKALTFNDSGNISFSINGKEFSFSSTTKLQDMLDTINNDATADVTMEYDSVADGFKLTSDTSGGSVTIRNISGNAFGSNSAFGIGEGTTNSESFSSLGVSTLNGLSFTKALTFDSSGKISFSINGKTFSFDKATKLQDMLNTINNDTTAKVSMSYNSTTDGFMITSDAGGDGSVNIKNIAGNAFGSNSAFGIPETTTSQGSDAVAVINGTTITKGSNEFTIDNITYKLNSVTKGTADEAIDFSVDRDYSATVNAVKTFVDAFNTMIKSLTDLTEEKDYSDDYPPLTETQESQMTQEQITTWNKKAKSGLLRHNNELTSFITNLKNAFYSTLGGTEKNATSIGITTAGYFDSNAGQLVLDTNALESALESDPDQVIKMFTNGSSYSASSEQGLMYKLRSVTSKYSSALKETLSKSETKVTDLDNDISDLQDKLDEAAERYYKKFSAMETALSKLNTQASYISQMFGSSAG
jgi:flagellar hook-associated protein 2